MRLLCLPILLLLATAVAAAKPVDRDKPFAWRTEVLQRDHNRIHNWRKAWTDAIAYARSHGATDRIAAEGTLLDPDAAENDASIADGTYRCRAIKLGGGIGYVEAPPVACTIHDGHFVEQDGAQRIAGYLWRYDGVRMLMLGALSLGDEKGSLPYGRDQQRDVLAFLERVAPKRWRLVIPLPAWESKLTVVEIVPAS